MELENIKHLTLLATIVALIAEKRLDEADELLPELFAYKAWGLSLIHIYGSAGSGSYIPYSIGLAGYLCNYNFPFSTGSVTAGTVVYYSEAEDLIIFKSTSKGKKPVSYTHLDVYKRQPSDIPMTISVIKAELLRCSSLCKI